MELIDYLRLLWKYKHILILIAIISTIAAFVVTFFMPPAYESTAMLEPQQSINATLGTGPSATQISTNINSYVLLVSDQNFQNEIKKRAKKRLKKIDEFVVTATLPERTTVLSLTAAASTPKEAQVLVEAAVELIIEKDTEAATKTRLVAAKNVAKKIIPLDKERVELVKEREQLLSQLTTPTPEKQLLDDKIAAAKSERDKARAFLAELNLAQSQNDPSVRANIEKDVNAKISEIDKTLESQRAQLAALESQTALDTPEKENLRSQIEENESIRRNYTDFLANLSIKGAEKGSAAYGAIKPLVEKQINEKDQELAKLSEEAKELEKKFADSRAQDALIADKIQTVDSRRKAYGDFLNNLSIANAAQLETFKLAYPPPLPTEPSQPILWLNLLAGFAAGILIGTGVAVVIGVREQSKKEPEEPLETGILVDEEGELISG